MGRGVKTIELEEEQMSEKIIWCLILKPVTEEQLLLTSMGEATTDVVHRFEHGPVYVTDSLLGYSLSVF